MPEIKFIGTALMASRKDGAATCRVTFKKDLTKRLIDIK